jgi:hypothetical protein
MVSSTLLKGFTIPGLSTLGARGAQRRGTALKTPATLDAAKRWDPDLPVQMARELADGQVIIDVLGRQRGGPLDVYFVVTDREKGYAAAVPIIRQVLRASSLSLDFHFMEPSEVHPGG